MECSDISLKVSPLLCLRARLFQTIYLFCFPLCVDVCVCMVMGMYMSRYVCVCVSAAPSEFDVSSCDRVAMETQV